MIGFRFNTVKNGLIPELTVPLLAEDQSSARAQSPARVQSPAKVQRKTGFDVYKGPTDVSIAFRHTDLKGMVAESVQGVEFIAANTDLQAIGVSLADNKIRLGAKLAKGLGGIAVTPIGKCVYSLEPDKIANAKYKLPISQKDAKTIVLSVIERLSKSTGEDSISDYFFNVLDQNYHEVHVFLNLIFFNLDYFVGILEAVKEKEDGKTPEQKNKIILSFLNAIQKKECEIPNFNMLSRVSKHINSERPFLPKYEWKRVFTDTEEVVNENFPVGGNFVRENYSVKYAVYCLGENGKQVRLVLGLNDVPDTYNETLSRTFLSDDFDTCNSYNT
tara:strand:- start:194 stop:1186 length:993 start_codon:yes stop_codon:yes gene_type:complete